MADDKKEKKEEIGGKESTSGKKGGLVGWIITFTVAIICATGGYGLSGLFAKNEAKVPDGSDTTVDGGVVVGGMDFTPLDPDAAKPWTFELETITANLNELGSSRMIQITVVIELLAEMDQTKGEIFLGEKVIHLRDWLQTYLSGLSLAQVKGSINQTRMKSEIRERFNEILFPDTKPLVNRVMFKAFILQ